MVLILPETVIRELGAWHSHVYQVYLLEFAPLSQAGCCMVLLLGIQSGDKNLCKRQGLWGLAVNQSKC